MKKWLGVAAAILLTVPWLVVFPGRIALFPLSQALISGLAIVGAAFLLSWGAEAAQLEISKSLSLAFVAMVAVLPEYAVDIYVAAKAGRDPAYLPYAIANMTGANRLIIGVAWAMVALLWWMRSKKKSVEIEEEHGMEFSFLLVVTIYSFVIPLKGTLSPLDGMVLIGFFVAYLWKAAKGKMEEPLLDGEAAALAGLPKSRRRFSLLLIFLYSFFVIGGAARPFTEGLIAAGRLFHLDGFLLIQILAPLASEAPEFIVSGFMAFSGKPGLGFGALLSSKLEQWTLLVGMVPLVYLVSLVSGGHPAAPLVLDHRQVEEILLTSGQCLFALALVADFDLSLGDAGWLFVLYATQYLFPSAGARYFYAIGYLFLGVIIFFFNRGRRKGMKRRLQTLR